MSRSLLLCLALLACSPGPGPEGVGGGEGGGGGGEGVGGGSPAVHRIVSLGVSAAPSIALGAAISITCTATFDDATTADVSGSVQWEATPPGVVSVAVNDGAARLSTVAAGTAQLVARVGSLESAPVTVTVMGTAARAEVRAVWVTRFAYNSAADVHRIIASAARGGFNVVYFQIRGTADAYYRSSLVPWAKKLTGTLGKDPGWDPLQTAIDDAHASGLQLHAYFNAFTAWPVPSGCTTSTCACSVQQGLGDSCALPEASAAGAPEHWLRAHPEALAVDASGKAQDTEYYWFSGGNAAYRAHLIAVATELLTHYAVDGLHLDRIRYPGTWSSYDSESQAAYAALPAPKPTHDDWQRENITTAVAGIYDALKAQRPGAMLSASVWGIYQRLPGCNTSEGFSQYFQDSMGWMRAGKIDAIAPMIYWDLNSGCTDWGRLLDGFLAGASGRPVIAGMLARDGTTVSPSRISARVEYGRRVGAAGVSLFASAYLDEPPLGSSSGDSWSALRADGGVFAADATVPPITWR